MNNHDGKHDTCIYIGDLNYRGEHPGGYACRLLHSSNPNRQTATEFPFGTKVLPQTIEKEIAPMRAKRLAELKRLGLRESSVYFKSALNDYANENWANTDWD